MKIAYKKQLMDIAQKPRKIVYHMRGTSGPIKNGTVMPRVTEMIFLFIVFFCHFSFYFLYLFFSCFSLQFSCLFIF